MINLIPRLSGDRVEDSKVDCCASEIVPVAYASLILGFPLTSDCKTNAIIQGIEHNAFA